MDKPDNGNWLLYDGECPVCSRYVLMIRLREAIGELELRDARQHPQLVDEMRERGFEINDGMILYLSGQYYYDADAIHALALISSQSGLMNRINAAIFRNKTISRLLYPMLKAGRRLLLALRRQAPIE